MRGTKAKKLRKQAATLTVGKPKCRYGEKKHYDALGRLIGTSVVLVDCTRAVYRNLKILCKKEAWRAQ